GAALKNAGIRPLLDPIVDWLPSPLDAKPAEGRDPESAEARTRRADPSEPFCGLAFKLQALAHGDLTFVRVYSGSIAAGAQLWNPRSKKLERVARSLRMHANHCQAPHACSAG